MTNWCRSIRFKLGFGFMFAVSSAYAVPVYIGVSGDDSFSGLTQAKPKFSFSSAISVPNVSEIIFMSDYQLDPAQITKPLTLRSLDKDNPVTIKRDFTDPSDNGKIFTVKSNDVIIKDIKFNLVASYPIVSPMPVFAAIYSNGYTNLAVDNCTFTIDYGTTGKGIEFLGTGSLSTVDNYALSVTNCTFTCKANADDNSPIRYWHGIRSFGANVSISNSSFHGAYRDLELQQSKSTLTGNTFHSNVNISNPYGTNTVSSNTFTRTPHNGSDWSNDEAAVTVRSAESGMTGASIDVTNNTLTGFPVSIWSGASKNVKIIGNTITPNALSSTTGAGVRIDTKPVSSSSAGASNTSVEVKGNKFLTPETPNTSGLVAIELVNNDTVNPYSSYDAIFGGTGSDANEFNTGYDQVIKASIDKSFDFSSNKFNVSDSLKVPSSMNLSELFNLEDKITHKLDNLTLGFVRVKSNEVFVTAGSGSIQQGIDIASSGDTINVQAGTYIENLEVDKPLSLVGPNSGIAGNAATRNPEAVVVPFYTGSNYSSLMLMASDVTVDGFSFDGQGGTVGSVADVDLGVGVTNGGRVKFLNNTVLDTKGYGFFGWASNNGQSYSDNEIKNNLFRGVTAANGGGSSLAIFSGYNFYSVIDGNEINNYTTGIQTDNNRLVGSDPVISNNLINVFRTGIFHNLQSYTGSSQAEEFLISNNTITAIPNTLQVEGPYRGIYMGSLEGNVSAQLRDNTISGFKHGIQVFNLETTNRPVVSGGSISGAEIGLYVGSRGPGYEGTVKDILFEDVDVTASQIGLKVEDKNDTGNAADVAKASLSGVTFHGGTKSVLVTGPDASVVLGDSAFDNPSSQYIVVENGSTGDIDATQVSFDGKKSSDLTLSELFSLEDKITHKLDNLTLGFVRVKSNEVFVTADSGSIQRGIDTASAGDAVHVGDGSYAELVNVNKANISLLGDNNPSVTAPTGSSNDAVIIAGAAGVKIDGFDVVVNQPLAATGISVKGPKADRDNIVISNNVVTTTGNGANSATKGWTPFAGSLGQSAAGITVWSFPENGPQIIANLENNTVGSAANPFSLAGIFYERTQGQISDNIVYGEDFDLISRFVYNGSLTIADNEFRGWGDERNRGAQVELGDMSAGGIVTVNNNLFAPQAGTSPKGNLNRRSLQVKNYYAPTGSITVSGNEFQVIKTGLALTNAVRANVLDNTFTAVADGALLLEVNNKVYSSADSHMNAIGGKVVNSPVITGNSLSGGGKANVTGLEFRDHTQTNAAGDGKISIENVTLGTSAKPNTFGADLTNYIALNGLSGSTRSADAAVTAIYGSVAPLADTMMVPFAGNISALNNLFGVGTEVLSPAAFNEVQFASVQGKIVDKNDNAALGSVRLFPAVVNVTTGENFATIQSAIDDADTVAGNTIEVYPGLYKENVVVNKSLTIQGVGLPSVPTEKAIVQRTNDMTGGVAISVTANGATIKDLTVGASAPSAGPYLPLYAAIHAKEKNNLRVENCEIFTDGGSRVKGIEFEGLGHFNTLNNYNLIVDSCDFYTIEDTLLPGYDTRFWHAIRAYGANVTVTDSEFEGAYKELEFSQSSSQVSGNKFESSVNISNPYGANVIENNEFICGVRKGVWLAPLEAAVTVRGANGDLDPLVGATISNNTFENFPVSVWSGASQNVVITNNTIKAPLASTDPVTAIRLDTKVVTSAGGNGTKSSVTVKGNKLFGTTASAANQVAFELVDNNAPNTHTQYDVAIGGAGAEANEINTGFGRIVDLKFNNSFTFSENKVDLGSGLKTVGSLSTADLFSLEDKINHKLDNSALGFVVTKENNVYVTANSGSIQLGVDAAKTSDVVNVASGTYAENVTINKSVIVRGVNLTSTPADDVIVTEAAATGNQLLFNLAADDVVVTGFRFEAGSKTGAAIYGHDVNNVTVVSNNFVLTGFGGKLNGTFAEGKILSNGWSAKGVLISGSTVESIENHRARIIQNTFSSIVPPNGQGKDNYFQFGVQSYLANLLVGGYAENGNIFSGVYRDVQAEYSQVEIGSNKLSANVNLLQPFGNYAKIMYNEFDSGSTQWNNDESYVTVRGAWESPNTGVEISNNTFNKTERGVWAGDVNHLVIRDNDFNAVAASNDPFSLIVVDSAPPKASSNRANNLNVIIDRNRFNGATGSAGQCAVEFADSNTNTNVKFDSVVIGGNDSYFFNSFNEGFDQFIKFGINKEHLGAGSFVDVSGNLYALPGVTGKIEDTEDFFALEDKLYHQADDNMLARLQLNINNAYVTADSGSIQRGIDASSIGGTVHVENGTYTENVNVNKGGIKLLGYGNPQVTAPASASNSALIQVTANDVLIKGFALDVNRPSAVAGIVLKNTSSSNSNNVTIENNAITLSGTGGSATNHVAFGTASVGVSVWNNGGSVYPQMTVKNNTIGSAAAPFDRAVFARSAFGEISGNTIFGANHDVVVQFVHGGKMTISNNNFNGWGNDGYKGAQLDITEPENNIDVIGNTFTPAADTADYTHVRSLMLKNINSSTLNLLIQNNTFNVRKVGVLAALTNVVTLDGNTFTPVTGAANFAHVQFSNKIPTSGAVAGRPLSGIVTSNTFNGPGGNALEFLNHNTHGGSLIGTLTLGEAGKENEFAGNLNNYVLLDGQSGAAASSSNPGYSVLGATTMAPFSADLDISANKFAGIKGSDVTVATGFDVERKVVHKVDNSTLGRAVIDPLKVYITTPVSGSTDSDVGRGILAAPANDATVYLEGGLYEGSRPTVDTKTSFTLEGTSDSVAAILGEGLTVSGETLNLTLRNLTVGGAQANTALGSVVNNVNKITGLVLDKITVDGNSVGTRHGIIGGQIGGSILIQNSEFKNIGGAVSGGGSVAFDTHSDTEAPTDGAEITTATLRNNKFTNVLGAVNLRHQVSKVPRADINIENNVAVNSLASVENGAGGLFKVFGAGRLAFIGNKVSGVKISSNVPANETDEYGAALLTRNVIRLYAVGNVFENNHQAIAAESVHSIPYGTIADNVFKNNKYGVYYPNVATWTDAIRVMNNHFEGQTGLSVRAEGSGIKAEAKENWFGTNDGPSGTNGVSAGVVASPWIGSSSSVQSQIVVATNETSLKLEVPGETVPAVVELGNATGFASGDAFSIAKKKDAAPQGYEGFVDGVALPRSLFVNATKNSSDFVAVIKLGYKVEEIPTGYFQDQLVLGTWNPTARVWEPAVASNSGGTAQFVGLAPAPAATVENLGKYGVDINAKIVWAVVDHASEYVAGIGNDVTNSSVGDWSAY